MRLGVLARSAVIFVPLLIICASRVHAQRAAGPAGMSKEVNRCLIVMRTAASRRKTNRERDIEERLAVCVRTDASPAWRRPDDRARTA
jgi:hypothetical protein